MKILSIALLVISTIACMPAQEVAESTPGNINQDAPYVWGNSTFPKTLRVSSNFDDAELANITAMAGDWSDSVDNEKTFFAFGARTPEITNSLSNMDSLYESNPIFGVYKSEAWPPSLKSSAPFALAVTQIFGRRHNIGSSNEFVAIEHADILVNYEEFAFDTTDSGTGYDLRTVVLHELGHFLGLQHKDLHWTQKDDSVMYPSIGPSEAKRYPRPVDASDLADKYGIDLGGGSANAAMARRKTYTTDPREPGQEIKILMELHADGECVHKVDGKVVKSHWVDLK